MRLATVATPPRTPRLPVQLESGPRQPAHRFPLLPLARRAGLVQALPQPPVVEGKAVAEQVGIDQAAAGFIFDRELDPRDGPYALALQSADGIDPSQGVVVSEGDGREPRGGVRGDDLGRRR